MKPRKQEVVETRVLAAYLEGEVTASEARKVERALEWLPETRRRFEQLKFIRDELSRPSPELEHGDVLQSVRSAIGRGEGPSVSALPKRPRMTWQVMALVAASVGLAIIAGQPWNDALSESGFRAKSALSPVRNLQSAAFQAYLVAGDLEPQPVRERIPSDAALLFSYRNATRQPYPYLMIFGVDSAHEVRWFYPAYVDPSTDPVSIAIAQTAAPTLLRETVVHQLATGPLVIYALFSREPLRVSEVERWNVQRTEDMTKLLRGGAVKRIRAFVGR